MAGKWPSEDQTDAMARGEYDAQKGTYNEPDKFADWYKIGWNRVSAERKTLGPDAK